MVIGFMNKLFYKEAETLLAQTTSGAKEILTNRQRLRSSMASLMTRSVPIRHKLSEYDLNFQWKSEERVSLSFTILGFL